VRLKDRLAKAVTGLHRAVFVATDGRLLGRAGGMPVVLLTTVGRRSGRRRSTMLTAPVTTEDTIVVVASYGGDDHHPAWFLNVRSNPDVEVRMRGTGSRAMRARVAGPDERADLWPRIVAAYGGYAGYQRKTGRDIPVVILEVLGRQRSASS